MWSPRCVCPGSLPVVGADGAAVWQRQQQRLCRGTAWVVLWVAPRFGLQQDAQTLGCEQRRSGVSTDTVAAVETFLGSLKGFSNQPVCISVGFPTGIFQGMVQPCLLQRGCGTGAPQPCPVLGACCRPWGRGGCSNPTTGKGLNVLC